jgi:hypothetical protein
LRERFLDGADRDEVNSLTRQLQATDRDSPEFKQLRKKLQGMAQSPMEALGALRLDANNDDAAMDAFRKIYENHRKMIDEMSPEVRGLHGNYAGYWNRPFEEVVKDADGSIMVDTVPKENLDLIRHNLCNPFATSSGFESFRGKRIQYCEIVPKDLVDEAFLEHDPEQMLDYAKRLDCLIDKELINRMMPKYQRYLEISEDHFLESAAKPGHEDEFELLNQLLWDKQSKFGENLTVHEAVHWLRFWAERGFSMWPWY